MQSTSVLATIGIVRQLIFGVYHTGQLWQGGRDPRTTTPVLYLPTVAGGFVSTITLSACGRPDWGVPLFGVGVLSRLAIESVLMHRLYSVELPPPLRPTLGIQLAPPTVGCAAYSSVLRASAGCRAHPTKLRQCCSAIAHSKRP